MALQTKTFTAGGTADTRYYSIRLKLTEESVSVSGNTSVVSYEFSIHRQNSGVYTGPYYSWTITIGGKSIAINNFAFNIPTSGAASQVIASGRLTIPHDADGGKDMEFYVYTPSAQDVAPSYGPPEIRLTGSWPLTTIPRASSVSAINADIGSDTLITISRASSAFTHTVTYKFGDLTGTIATKTAATSIPWTVPDSFYGEIPNAKYGTVTLTCKTYSGSTLLGSKTATFRATAPEALCKPDVSGAAMVTDDLTKGLTGNDTTVIRYVSEVEAAIAANPKNGATIASRTVNGKALTDTLDFPNAETGVFVFSATDGRGYTGSRTVNLDFVSYIPLTLTPTVNRVTPTGDIVAVNIKGNFWEGNFGVVDNALTISYQYRQDGGEWSDAVEISGASISEDGYSVSANVTSIDYRESYVFRFTAEDSAMTLTQDVGLSQGIPVFEWGKGDFRFHVPVEVMGTMQSDWCKVDAKGGWSSLSLQKNGVTMSGFTINPDTGNLHILMYYGDSGHAERYVLNAPDKAISEDIVYYLLSTKNVQDYVVATGATKNWRWRKWKSGIAECWQRLWVNTDAFVLENGIYRANVPKSRLTLPFTFTDTPKVLVNVDPFGYEVWLTTYPTGGIADNSHTGAYALFRKKAAGADEFVLNYYVQGFYT